MPAAPHTRGSCLYCVALLHPPATRQIGPACTYPTQPCHYRIPQPRPPGAYAFRDCIRVGGARGRRPQQAPEGPRRPQEAPEGPRRPQEAPGGTRQEPHPCGGK